MWAGAQGSSSSSSSVSSIANGSIARLFAVSRSMCFDLYNGICVKLSEPVLPFFHDGLA